MIRCGEISRVLIVAGEASVHPLFVGSFGRMGVLPREGMGCRPFDRDRDGFRISEAEIEEYREAHSPRMHRGAPRRKIAPKI